MVLAVVRVSDTTETAEQIRSVLKIQSALLEGLVPLGRVKADLHAVIVSLRQSGVNRGGAPGVSPTSAGMLLFTHFVRKNLTPMGGVMQTCHKDQRPTQTEAWPP